MVEWIASILIALSLWFYPAVYGWRRFAAPSLGLVGNLIFVFLFIPIDQLSGGLVALNIILAIVNCWNLCKAVWDHYE